MARFPRLDPEFPRGVVLSTKLSATDAERLIDQAGRAGLSKSEYLRGVVLDALGRAEPGPPDEAAA